MPLIPDQYSGGNISQLQDMLDWLQNRGEGNKNQFKNPLTSIDLSNYPGLQPNNLMALQSMMYGGGSTGGAEAAVSPFNTMDLYNKIGPKTSPNDLTAIYDLVQQILKSRPAKQ